MKKLIETYQKANKFCKLMKKYEAAGVTYNSAINIEEFVTFENEQKKGMKEAPKTLIVGTLIYLIRHPKKMISAQIYYIYRFGKSCPIKK